MHRHLAPITLLALAACAHHRVPELPWTFEARAAGPELVVLPVLDLHTSLPVELASALGPQVPHELGQVRRQRSAQLEQIPAAVGDELPAALAGGLARRWQGHLQVRGWPLGARHKVLAALQGRAPLDKSLSQVGGRGRGVDGYVVTWVEKLDAVPLSALEMPGTTVQTELGPVLVDHADEPYQVDVLAGVAVVSDDGEVILRYADTFQTVLSGRLGPERAGAEVARALADEVIKVWWTEPDVAGW